MYRKYITQKEFKRLLENSPSNVRFVVYYVNEGRRVKVMKPKKKNKYTLDQLGMTVDKLVIAVNDLTKVVKRIEARLDYNGLKDLPKNYKY
ncbi:MAG: hypothetical protein MJ208_00165 [Bacilli bacterium]|nr:hypothetical protein [Bacilli bacterium]